MLVRLQVRRLALGDMVPAMFGISVWQPIPAVCWINHSRQPRRDGRSSDSVPVAGWPRYRPHALTSCLHVAPAGLAASPAVVHDTIMLIWTMTGTTAATITTATRINTTAAKTTSAKITVRAAGGEGVRAWEAGDVVRLVTARSRRRPTRSARTSRRSLGCA